MSIYRTSKDQEKRNRLKDDFKRALFNKDIEGSCEALQYLKDRGLSDELIEKFEIGFYPSSGRIVQYLDTRLIGRVIFPIQDEFGDVIIFSGRLPISDEQRKKLEIQREERIPKYFHESFHKSLFVYGLNVTWPHILNENSVVITEGQLDVITCFKNGIKNVVGLMGSAFSGEMFAKLRRYAEIYYIFLDGDEAGQKEAQNSLEILTEFLSDDKYYILPLRFRNKTFDPDTFLNKFGREGYGKLLFRSIEEKKKQLNQQASKFKSRVKNSPPKDYASHNL